MQDHYYAELIIKDPSNYDAIEIHGVREAPEHPGCCEVDDTDPLFYSTYVHLKRGGLECVGDFNTAEAARDYAEQLSRKYGWPITFITR
jgi:hypothetical protein